MTDSADRVIRLDPETGVEQGVFGSSGSGPGEFNFPTGISVDVDGTLYVADANNARIQKFTRDFDYIAAWQANGSRQGLFYQPSAVAVGRTVPSTWRIPRITGCRNSPPTAVRSRSIPVRPITL